MSTLAPRLLVLVPALLALLTGRSVAQDGAAESPADPAAAVAAIDAALKLGDDPALVEAIRDAAAFDDAAVAKALTRAAARDDRAVKSSALEALGRVHAKESLEFLHETYWRDKNLREDEALFVTLLRAIARHGDPSSVKVLSDSPFDHLTLATGRARILGLANVRTKESAEALIQAMRLAGSDRGGARARSDQPFMPSFRAALTILCAKDAGPTKEEWQAYWHEATKGSGQPVKPYRPAVPPFARKAWEDFYGEPYAAESTETPTNASGVAGAEPPKPIITSPTPEQTAEAVRALEEATKSGEEPDVLAAVESARLVIDPKVIAEIAKLRNHKSVEVESAALDALGRMPHPDALRALHDSYRRDKQLREDEHMLPKLLKAIGRHGDKSSIEILADKPLKNLTRESGTARIYGLARIRDNGAIEALTKAMTLGGSPRSSGPGARSNGPRFLEEMRVAMCVLTGEDLGTSKEAWISWWQKQKKAFKVSSTPPMSLPPVVKATFDEYWE